MPPLSPLLTCIVPEIIYKCLPGMSPTASKDLVDGSAAASHSGVLCPCFLGRGIVSIVSKLIVCSISSETGSGDIGAGLEKRCRRLFISVLCLAACSHLLSVFGNTSVVDVVLTFADVGLTLLLSISTDVGVGLVLTIGLVLVLVTAVDIGLGQVLDTSAGVGLGLVLAESVLTLSVDVGVGLVLTIGLGLVMVTAVDIGLGLVLISSASIGLGLVVWCVAEDFFRFPMAAI